MKKFLIQFLLIFPVFFWVQLYFAHMNDWVKFAVQFTSIFIILYVSDTLIDRHQEREEQ